MSAAAPRHVSLIAIPEAMASTLTGVYDTLSSVSQLGGAFDGVPAHPPFDVEIVGNDRTPVHLASGLPVAPHRGCGEIATTDIIVVPSLLVAGGAWQDGRYPALTSWIEAMHASGAVLCSACSGIFLLAENGLFDRQDATIHWSYASAFRASRPDVAIYEEKALVVSGDRDQYVSCGAATSWHDLVLYLVGRYAGPTASHAVAKFYAMQWHTDGLAPYVIFDAPRNHGDALIEDFQDWLSENFSIGSPVEEMVRRSPIPERSFKRRFSKATGHAPLAYVQRLRIEEAKRQLERTAKPVDEISWIVGYEDAAFFRRLFKRIAGVSPGVYRRRFQPPLSIGRAPAADPIAASPPAAQNRAAAPRGPAPRHGRV